LESLLGRCTGTAIEVAPTVFGSSAKKAFVDALRSAGKEGAVFKDLYATWTECKQASGGPALKLKFWETCSCVVLRVNAQRSIEVGLDGHSVGSVTIPPNYSVPAPGQVVEVRYLYVAAQGGSLYQPVYLGVRDDIDPGECTAKAQNLKYKAAA
jgi:bifunctional non-homologous end joining protein LigD